MITLVSKQQGIVAATNAIKREDTKILCDVNGRWCLLAEYKTEAFTEKVMSEIVDEMTKRRVSKYVKEYTITWCTEEVRKHYTLPTQEKD